MQQYATLRRMSVLELLLAVIVFETGEAAGRFAAQHEVLLLECLQFLQVATAYNGPAQGQRQTPVRGHRHDDYQGYRRSRNDTPGYNARVQERGPFVLVSFTCYRFYYLLLRPFPRLLFASFPRACESGDADFYDLRGGKSVASHVHPQQTIARPSRARRLSHACARVRLRGTAIARRRFGNA